MRAIFGILLSALAVTAGESTNRPSAKTKSPPAQTVPYHILRLNQIKAQVDATEKRLKQLQDYLEQEQQRYSLESAAGKIGYHQHDEWTRQRNEFYHKNIAPLQKLLAELKLQEFNLRRQYGIPEETAPKRR